MAKAHTLVDNFNDNSTDTAKWWSWGPVREVNQRVEIRPESAVAGSYGGYTSAASLDLTESYARVEVSRVLRHAGAAETYLSAKNAAADRVVLEVKNGLIRCLKEPSGGPAVTLAQQPYDAGKHRWWQLREQLGVLYFEVSPDACEWTVLAAVPTPYDLTSVKVGIAAGTHAAVPSPGVAVFDSFNTPETGRARRIDERRLSAREVREEAAELAARLPHGEHANNNDEVNYPQHGPIGNYRKGLASNPAAYPSLLRALESRDPADFEEILLAAPTDFPPPRLVNPQGGLAFDAAGPDAQALTMPPAPRFDSEQTAHEMGELYWMALARDVPFTSYATDPTIAAAVASLNTEFPRFGGTVPVTTANVFRGIYPGEQVGPYVSQFLWKGNVDPRKPDGTGRDADEGFITYGAQRISQMILPAEPGVDHILNVVDLTGVLDGWIFETAQFETVYRFIHTLRDGATYVHFDQVINAFYNAAMILLSEPTGNQLTFVSGSTGQPMVTFEFPKNAGNPYDPPGTAMDSRTQVGFGTFGPIHLLQVLGEVLGRAIRAVWWQKWGVHRRLRPEEFGLRIFEQQYDATIPIHPSIITSLETGALSTYPMGAAGNGTRVLPQAYPEGAPTHPAYGAGHATGAGACATILKAFFDESKAIENPVQASADGLTLIAYTGADAGQMTVGGELNKLAGNIALFRDAAGVHWRSDYTESLPFGEAIAIRLLQEMSLGFNEDDAFFELTKFDGQKIRIFDGKVVPVA